MDLQKQIEQAINENFSVAFMQLDNESHMHAGPASDSHFKLTLVTSDFDMLSRVKRQQAVYRALVDLMPQFHALALHTYTPQEWQEKSGVIPASPKCGGGH
ncbi:BolA family transcriptional regulator [Thiosulfatimonas sediminis]|uniref:BolA family transcriptional regulator n=1 Tax=Thiosulfatimonas sediminis TaxID=2675054 RepID=A0A6F8PT94_9GAMM|nr:BolA family protein [Thiosulfatimonas sediminis]BBP45362.1 BolA family transcriptional regulator [Thiosulfatimonas sediminis]